MTAPTSPLRHTAIGDGALAAGLLAACLLTAPLLNAGAQGRRPVDVVGYALLVLACAPIVVRRRVPVMALAVTTSATSLYLVLGYPYGPIFAALGVVVYTAGRHTTALRAILASIAALVGLSLHLVVGAAPAGLLGLLPAVAWIATPLTVGVSRRLVVESRARERAETERRRLDDERLRLATEVHDIVGHGLAAIQLQADIALHLAETKPDQGRTALQAISAASAAALRELRTTLEAIAPSGPDAEQDAYAPPLGLAHLDALCGQMRRAGVAVELAVNGVPRCIAADADLAAYRIVQETLTNVVKHADEKRARVDIDIGPDALTITVASPHDGSDIEEGFGIRGMRRRVRQLGGELAIDPGQELVVHARLPTLSEQDGA